MHNHNDIIFDFLSQRKRRFVENVGKEFAAYNYGSEARPGCLKRDAVRVALTNLAYSRYNRNGQKLRRKRLTLDNLFD